MKQIIGFFPNKTIYYTIWPHIHFYFEPFAGVTSQFNQG